MTRTTHSLRVARARQEHVMLELNRLFSTIMIAAVAIMVPWTIFLAVTLPMHFHAHDWSVAWVGFDSVLMVVLLSTAWAAWFRRQILAMMSVVAATMLLCDAWFDVNTSIGTKDQFLSILTALIANVPLATFFILLARHIMLRTAAVLAVALNTGPAPHHAHLVALPFPATGHADNSERSALGTSPGHVPQPPAISGATELPGSHTACEE